ncbi:MAG: hypothetical protein BKP49_08085 [Treponema sp. CETP13]|nr:MAG: hypothetical protein BKP49_08085 [Treponema sp. CETP13]
MNDFSKPKLSYSIAIAFSIFATIAVVILCVCVGSVYFPLSDVLSNKTYHTILFTIRLPRVLGALVTGAALSVCGGAMQGLLRNPLADGTTLGVSAGASLGAVIAIFIGLYIPWLPGGGTVLFSIAFAFASLLLILGLSAKLDYSLSSNTIILLGIVFTMFANSIISLLIAFSGEKIQSITFWMMGSLANTSWQEFLLLLIASLICIPIILSHSQELNAFAISEDNARNIGINVRRTKFVLFFAVSALTGVCVSVCGNIGFVGLIIPHITRLITGPNHKRLLPVTILFGGIFLMLADLLCRTIIKPLELPIGVITSIAGTILFLYFFVKTRSLR